MEQPKCMICYIPRTGVKYSCSHRVCGNCMESNGDAFGPNEANPEHAICAFCDVKIQPGSYRLIRLLHTHTLHIKRRNVLFCANITELAGTNIKYPDRPVHPKSGEMMLYSDNPQNAFLMLTCDYDALMVSAQECDKRIRNSFRPSK